MGGGGKLMHEQLVPYVFLFPFLLPCADNEHKSKGMMAAVADGKYAGFRWYFCLSPPPSLRD